MKDIEIVLENLASQGIKADEAQKLFLEEFIDSDSGYQASKLFKKKSGLGSLYLWGPVGRGKTLLIQAIADSYFNDVGVFHFIEFMQMIQVNLSQIKGIKDPLPQISKNLSKKYKVIFIDEFQVEDIADAMIIGIILESLHANGVRLMLSSNAAPDNLYKDGLQRDKFLQTIHFICTEFLVCSLEGREDYRLRTIAKFDTSTAEDIAEFLHHTFKEPWHDINTLTVNKRQFLCKGQSSEFLWLSFAEFFSAATGSKDFIEICKHFEWIFISDFHACSDDHLDKIRRLISFIDIAYQEKQKMKLFAQPALLQNLYLGVQLELLWERSASRLHEISSQSYLEALKEK